VSSTLKVCCIESTIRGKCSCKVTAMIQRVIDSLDRICSACMAATSQETWEQLHRNKTCPNKVVP